MGRVRYRVAASLDGYLAEPNGEIDWIVRDLTIDWASFYAGFDTVLLGRHMYELTRQPGAPAWPAGWRVYVFSRTPTRQRVQPSRSSVEMPLPRSRLSAPSQARVSGCSAGGSLCASLLAADLVDQIEVAILPVLLARGIPLVGPKAPYSRLKLTHSDASPSSIVSLHYDVQHAAG